MYSTATVVLEIGDMKESSALQFLSQRNALRARFGIARVDITPPLGIYSRNWGAALHDTATSIHRPLTLTALVVVGDDNSPLLFYLDADLGWWKTPQTYQQFMGRLKERCGFAEHHVIFALSHTHAGPPLMQAEAELPGSDLLNAWMEQLLERAVSVVSEAQQLLFDGLLEWGVGHCMLAANRDLPDPSYGSSRVICGLNPENPADDTLVVGRISDESGRIRGTLTNYACHPTTLAWDNSAISPDYIGAMRATVEAVTHSPSLFMLGACGDLAPRLQYVGDLEVADRHGRQLAYATLSVLEQMEPAGTALRYAETVESGAPLAVWKHFSVEPSTIIRSACTQVELPIKDWPSAEVLEQERAACEDRAIEERLRRKRDIRRGIGDANTFALPIYVWRLGDAIIVGSCCEPYSELQQELRRRFVDRTLVCMNLINGSIGYLPPTEMYDLDVYPVWQTPFDRGSFEKTLEAMSELISHVVQD
ncbi:neutral/alkaline non-lysosomal ceramidase N-terminal domain-containing protein [Pirellulaceae bacterium SH449]